MDIYNQQYYISSHDPLSCGGLPACDHHPPDPATCQRLDRPSACLS